MFKKPTGSVNKEEESEPVSPKFGGSAPVNKSEQQAIKHTGTVGKSHHQFLKLTEKTPESKSSILVTPEELACHVTEDDAWLSLNGVVYDVTKYMKHHPGGKEKLLSGCGIECKQLFNRYHPWVNGKYLLQKFKIGNLSHSNHN